MPASDRVWVGKMMDLNKNIPLDVLEELRVVIVGHSHAREVVQPAIACAWDIDDSLRVDHVRKVLSQYEPSALNWRIIEVSPGDSTGADAWVDEVISVLRNRQ